MRKTVPTGYPYPASDRAHDDYSAEQYDLDRMAWARKLTEVSLRELASEYMRGHVDECTEDAYREYQRRLKLNLLGSAPATKRAEKTLKSRKSRAA